jgi:neutral ceramidase
MRSRIFAGSARVDITPPVGSALSGFIARLHNSTGISDRLHARAVVISDGEALVAILQLDLLGIGSWHVDEIRRSGKKLFGIPAENVLISSTHTHSGPGMVPIRGCDVAPLEYQWSVVQKAIEALGKAYSSQERAEALIGAVPFRLGVNRRQPTPEGFVRLGVAPNRPAPKDLKVVTIRTASGKTVYLFTHAAHPYVLGAENSLISGDFPSIASQILEKDAKPVVAMFLNGCAGNIAPISAFQGIEKAREEGQRLASAVLQAAKASRQLRLSSFGGCSDHVRLEYRKLPSVRQIADMATEPERTVRPEERENSQVAAKVRQAYAVWANRMQRIVERQDPLEPVFVEVQVLRVGELGIIGISGEPFFETGEAIVRASCFPFTWPLGYCNSYSGYLPTARSFREGGYEVNDSYRYLGTWQIDPRSEAKVVAGAKALLRNCVAGDRKLISSSDGTSLKRTIW